MCAKQRCTASVCDKVRVTLGSELSVSHRVRDDLECITVTGSTKLVECVLARVCRIMRASMQIQDSDDFYRRLRISADIHGEISLRVWHGFRPSSFTGAPRANA